MSHGEMAGGVIQSAKLIVGDVDYLEHINAYVDENNDVDKLIDEYLRKNKGETIIVVTDIFGGSVNNSWLKRLNSVKNLYLVSGMSLQLIIQLVLSIDSQNNADVKKIIKDALALTKQGFKFCNEIDLNSGTDEF